MKKIILILLTIMTVSLNSFSFATADNSVPDFVIDEVNSGEVLKENNDSESNITEATDKILSNMSKKDRKIAEYTDKYNNKTNAYVAYYLEVIQLYSIPVCIIGLAIGAFNFYIIGEKKLDKREQGFGYIMAFLCGLVFFQVLPFIFALLVAGK